MSNAQVHGARRIRILTPTGIPVAAPAAARERFRQMVQPSRRCEAFVAVAGNNEDDSHRSLARLPQLEMQSAAPATAAPAAPTATPAAPPSPLPSAPAPVAARDGPDSADDGDDLGNRIACALVREQRTQLVVEHLAHRVAELCNAPEIAAGGSWEFRLDIDPAVLPDTSLLLRLGGGRLSLRFDSRDDAARRLVREHRPALAAKLAATLHERYEIQIDAW